MPGAGAETPHRISLRHSARLLRPPPGGNDRVPREALCWPQALPPGGGVGETRAPPAVEPVGGTELARSSDRSFRPQSSRSGANAARREWLTWGRAGNGMNRRNPPLRRTRCAMQGRVMDGRLSAGIRMRAGRPRSQGGLVSGVCVVDRRQPQLRSSHLTHNAAGGQDFLLNAPRRQPGVRMEPLGEIFLVFLRVSPWITLFPLGLAFVPSR